MTGSRHFPLLWKFRLLRLVHAKGCAANRQVLAAWAQAEGGTARYNPLNTTQPWPGSTYYNAARVRNYPSAAAGLAATAATLTNGLYDGLVRDLRAGRKSARQLVLDNAGAFNTWGTGAAHVLACL